MKNDKLIIIGGSAGSVDVLLKVIPQIPKNLQAPIVAVIHRKANVEDVLTDLLQNKSKISVREACDKDELIPGVACIAPGNYHLFIEDNKTISLDVSDKLLHSRPSIDLAMESAVDAYGDNVTGILLTGANEDGSKGMKAIKDAGGCTVIQDPATAEVPLMPETAETFIDADLVLDIKNIIRFLLDFDKQKCGVANNS